MNLLAILGTGAALYQIFKPKDPVAAITDHAMLLTGEMVSQGVPVAEAAKTAVAQAVDQHFVQTGQLPPAPLPVQQIVPEEGKMNWRVTWTMPGGGKSGVHDYATRSEADYAFNTIVSSGATNVKIIDISSY